MTNDSKLSSEQLAELQAVFTAYLPKLERNARIKLAGRSADLRSEGIAEAMALAWKACCDLAADGRDPETMLSTIADFAIGHVKEGRKITGIEKAQDVFSWRAQARNGFKRETGSEDDDAMNVLADRRAVSPADEAVENLDMKAWKDQLTPKKRELIDRLLEGYDTSEVAARNGVTTGAVALLRRELRADWDRDR